ncbi:hypothetical protein PHYSODRAFT_302007 [Phytophthora sojae]|uniref:Uncharacterized protein n=1 Tax=Phytophthora sojae (strain P6497) TaxID=1094619 RepID=G4ZQH5_PHYSP|nr:hypothetical protein PHYSODRAFT_302007 [Phytophthora sojae]EGZ15503.1 hypothetical protein PHYSODRAFT_302007 [Phytophthora sojae]|eukprot:XP_009529252.1 hypothetical protein PHYSODRAFT_302007 [Phytophthora sojae]
MFPEVAACSSVKAVQVLYENGDISPDLVEAAFQNAAQEISSDVLEFLYKTGCVGAESVRCAVLDAADRGDVYVVDCMINFGCVSRELLENAQSKYTSIRTRRTLLRACKSLPPTQG